MAINVGKISGPLLRDDLLRDGINLAFETDLVYLDVNNRRVGINTASPSHDLRSAEFCCCRGFSTR